MLYFAPTNPTSRSFPSILIPVYRSKGAARHIEEKVPNSNPNKIGKQKSKITLPPHKQRASNDKTVVNEVNIVLERVSFIE